jgi:hypothetical protein
MNILEMSFEPMTRKISNSYFINHNSEKSHIGFFYAFENKIFLSLVFGEVCSTQQIIKVKYIL